MSFRSIIAPVEVTPRRASVEIFMCVLFWGASFASMKVAVGEISPFVAVWFRLVFGMFIVVPAALYRGEFRRPFRDEVVPLVVLGFLGIAFHQNIQFAGMREAGVANSNWLIAATPAAVAILAWIFLKEKLNPLAIIGLLASGAGVLLIVGGGTRGLGAFNPRAAGDILIAVSAVNWAVFQILSRRMLKDSSPTFSILWMNIFALAIQSGIVFIFSPRDFSGLLNVSVGGWCAVVFLGCVCSGLCYILWYDGLAVLTTAKVSAFLFLQPVIGVLVAYFFMGERFTYLIYIGGALVLSGVWMVNNGKN